MRLSDLSTEKLNQSGGIGLLKSTKVLKIGILFCATMLQNLCWLKGALYYYLSSDRITLIITILRCIWSAAGKSLTLFLRDTTYDDDPFSTSREKLERSSVGASCVTGSRWYTRSSYGKSSSSSSQVIRSDWEMLRWRTVSICPEGDFLAWTPLWV